MVFSVSKDENIPVLPPAGAFLPSTSDVFTVEIIIIILPSSPMATGDITKRESGGASVSLIATVPFLHTSSDSNGLGLVPNIQGVVSASGLSEWPSPGRGSTPTFSDSLTVSPVVSQLHLSRTWAFTPLFGGFGVENILLAPVPRVTVFLPFVYSGGYLRSVDCLHFSVLVRRVWLLCLGVCGVSVWGIWFSGGKRGLVGCVGYGGTLPPRSVEGAVVF